MPKRTGLPLPVKVKQRFFELIHAGYSQRESAAAAGVSESRASRWFHQAGGVSIDEPYEINQRFLSLDDRVAIADGVRAYRSKPAIAEAIGKSAATVYREIARHSKPDGSYDPYYAHNKAYLARRRDRPTKLASDDELRAEVAEKLATGWSPAQISRHLTSTQPNWRKRVCAESIYQAFYEGLLERRPAKLRTGRHTRKPRSRRSKRAHSGPIPGRISIRERPPAADARTEPGHWEGDLIVGRHGASQIGTLVDRHTRYLRLIHLPTSRTADALCHALTTQLADLPPTLRRSLTWDQGSEMAHHRETTKRTGIPIYFCDPHAPWQRPTNENTNGLLREYFPKRTDLSQHPIEELRRVEHLLNTRPRRVLEWATPEDRMAPWIPRQTITTTRNHR